MCSGAIGHKTNSHNLSFDLKGDRITCEENVKLLGVTIDFQQNFDKHTGISVSCKKERKQNKTKTSQQLKYPYTNR